MTNKYNYKPLLILFQYHNNNTTNIYQYCKCYLTVIVSLRVSPLLAYDLYKCDVTLLLFGSLALSCL